MEMIKANRDPSVEIKASDRFAYHVRLERRSVRPGNEQYPEVSHHIKCYPKDTFEKMEALRNARSPIIWYRAGGFTSATVVHDPNLEEPEEVKATEKTDVSEARKAQQRERMRIANAKRAANKAADNAK
jgi:hypothetical protein